MKWHIIKALLWKYWYITKRRIDRVFDIFYWPFTGLLIWGFTTYYVRDISQMSEVLNVFLGGAILWTFFLRANQDITVYILEDFWSRNLYNMFASPVSVSELVVSTLILGLIRSFLSFVFLGIVALLLYSFNIFSIGVLAISIFALGLLLFGWVVGIITTAIIFKYGMRIQVIAWSLAWIIQPFSAVFYPLSSVPQWLQNISVFFPTTHIFEGMRHAFSTGEIAWTSLGYSFVLNIILFFVAGLILWKSLNNARKSGILTRND